MTTEEDKIIGDSELVLHPDGSVYHLGIKPEHLANNVILVGDPGRVEKVSVFFYTIEFTGHNREFIVQTGRYRDKRITVMSTGMGTDNIDIVLNELDALVNIDLDSRRIKREHTSLNLFRLGTSGSIQPDLPLNAVVVSSGVIGFDGLLHYYRHTEEPYEKELIKAFTRHMNLDPVLPEPYFLQAGEDMLRLFDFEGVHKGITITAPGFYGPQGRSLRLPLAMPGINDKLQTFRFGDEKILNYEMETSALYGLSRILGHKALTVCLAIANRHRKAVSGNYHEAMEMLINRLLSVIVGIKD